MAIADGLVSAADKRIRDQAAAGARPWVLLSLAVSAYAIYLATRGR